jgi:hypothetical protein
VHRAPDRDTSWARRKAGLLVKTYIVENSDLQVNISQVMQLKVVSNVGGDDKDAVARAFDDALEEIVRLVQQGPWLYFYSGLENAQKREAVIVVEDKHLREVAKSVRQASSRDMSEGDKPVHPSNRELSAYAHPL